MNNQIPRFQEPPDIEDFEKPGMFQSWGEAVRVAFLALVIIGGGYWFVSLMDKW